MPQLDSKRLTKIIILISLLITIIAIYILLTLTSANKPAKLRDNSTSLEDINIGGYFELTDMQGNQFNSKKLLGKLSLIYFGFTFCPDICPTSLNKLAGILNSLEKYKINTNAIFITVDPNRDTQTVLKNYLTNFNPHIIGLTGSEEEIKTVADKFKVYYARSKNKCTDANNYMLDHTSFIYVLDKKGKYLKHFYMSSSPEEIIEFIRVNK